LPESVGQFEQIILTAILSLRDEAYGVTIHKKAVQLAAPKNISLGAVYVTLDRLEDKGLISSWLSDPTPERVAAPNASIVRFSFFAATPGWKRPLQTLGPKDAAFPVVIGPEAQTV
jgi:hypothetical protein